MKVSINNALALFFCTASPRVAGAMVPIDGLEQTFQIEPIEDKRVANDPGSCNAVVSFSRPEVSGANSPFILFVFEPESGRVFELGTTTVSVTATDGGASAEASFDVLVEDEEAPTLSVTDATYNIAVDTGDLKVVAWSTTNATDNCGSVSHNDTVSIYTCSDLGTFPVTIVAHDQHGNTATATKMVTVTDEDGLCNPVLTNPTDDDAIIEATENTDFLYDIDATDSTDSEGDGLTYTITGGANADSFVVDGISGTLSFGFGFPVPAYDEEGGNNLYEVEATVTNSLGLTDVVNLFIEVVPDVSAPTCDGPEYAFRCKGHQYLCGENLMDKQVTLPRPGPRPEDIFLPLDSSECQEMIMNQCAAACPNSEKVGVFAEFQCDGSSSQTECRAPPPPRRRLGEVAAAEKACSHVKKASARENCISEVLTQARDARLANAF